MNDLLVELAKQWGAWAAEYAPSAPNPFYIPDEDDLHAAFEDAKRANEKAHLP